jgi:uncharacterized protein YjbI with pentapeptide repeats
VANQQHVNLLREQGIAQWNEWREQHLEIRPDLQGVSLHELDLRGADLRGANLSYGSPDHDLQYGPNYLDGADLSHADLNHAELNYAQMDSVKLYCANLRYTDLSNTNLSNADLSRTNSYHAKFNDANLSHANLSGAGLPDASLRGANLSSANLSSAWLSNTDLDGANLNGANLSGASIEKTVFAHVDLREVKGLLEVKYNGPSTVMLSTIRLPSDGSALYFLRGTGISDEWIEVYRTMMMFPIQYHSCFISYSNKDGMLARRLHADLQTSGVRCWFAPKDLKIGDKFRQRIDEAIHLQDKLLLLLSNQSIASTWVESEVEAALEKEDRQQREILFPIRLDDTVMQTSQAWAATLRRTRHIGDFTNWTEPQAYQIAFDRLLRDLKKVNQEEIENRGN